MLSNKFNLAFMMHRPHCSDGANMFTSEKKKKPSMLSKFYEAKIPEWCKFLVTKARSEVVIVAVAVKNNGCEYFKVAWVEKY